MDGSLAGAGRRTLGQAPDASLRLPTRQRLVQLGETRCQGSLGAAHTCRCNLMTGASSCLGGSRIPYWNLDIDRVVHNPNDKTTSVLEDKSRARL